MKVAILGAGAWGIALANLLSKGGIEVHLWGHNPARMDDLHRTRQSTKLRGVGLLSGVKCGSNLAFAVAGAEFLLISVPSEFFRSVATRVSDYPGIAVSVTKGIEYDTGLTMTGILRESMPKARVCALSGPTLALEVAKGMPCASVVAAENADVARAAQGLLHRPLFRVYSSQDVLGVELGGALKNVIAIGVGICDGLGLGNNSKAALLTRAIVEIRRLGVARGAQAETFSGLSGLGDLTVTCFSSLSRNRGFGERLGKGEALAEVLATMNNVAEGYPTARSAWKLARDLGVDTPIMSEVHHLLYEGKSIREAFLDLVGRESKPE